MVMSETNITAQSTMREVLEACPAAQRALFRKYHIGGCSSCGFQPEETLEEVCRRNNDLNVDEVLGHIRTSHAQDEQLLISPRELAQRRLENAPLKLLDIRSRDEFEAVRIEGSVLMSQATMQEILAHWRPADLLVIIDHQGRSGLDAAAYFQGHGLQNVRSLRGGIDAWAQEMEPQLRRYRLG